MGYADAEPELRTVALSMRQRADAQADAFRGNLILVAGGLVAYAASEGQPGAAMSAGFAIVALLGSNLLQKHKALRRERAVLSGWEEFDRINASFQRWFCKNWLYDLAAGGCLFAAAALLAFKVL